MEYRVKYRDLPWSVAFGVLPGKIIGHFILKPVHWVIHHPHKTLSFLLFTLLGISLTGLILVLANIAVDGAVAALVNRWLEILSK